MYDPAVALAAIGLVTVILTVVVRPLLALLRENTKATTALARNMDKVAKTNEKIATKTERVATATETGNREAKERNGHLAELVLQSNENTRVIADKATETIVAAVQHVKKQEVEHQFVKESKKV